MSEVLSIDGKSVGSIVRDWFDVRIADAHETFDDLDSIEITIGDINKLMEKIGFETFRPVKLFRVSGQVTFNWSVDVKAASEQEAKDFVEDNRPDFSLSFDNENDYEDADYYYSPDVSIDEVEEV